MLVPVICAAHPTRMYALVAQIIMSTTKEAAYQIVQQIHTKMGLTA